MFFKKFMISTLSEKKNENWVLQTLIYPAKTMGHNLCF